MIIEKAQRFASVKEYYFSLKLKEIAARNADGADILNLGIGSPDLSPDPAVIRVLSETATAGNHGYQPYKGTPQLRDAVAGYYGTEFSVDVTGETEVLPLIGSKEGILHISMAFLNPGDRTLVPNPGYPSYRGISTMIGAEVLEYKLDAHTGRIDFESLEKQVEGVKIIWTNYPNMPTGAVADREEMTQLIALAKKHQFLIVNDNPYHQILTEKPFSIFEIEGAKDVCLELGSLSKSHNMAGWRVGWIVGNENYINAVLQAKSNVDSGMFKPVQLAAAKALSLSNDWYIKLNEQYAERKVIASKLLLGLGCEIKTKQDGLFIWATIPNDAQDAESFADVLVDKHGLFIPPGTVFGSQGKRHIRLSLCSPLATFEKALKRITI